MAAAPRLKAQNKLLKRMLLTLLPAAALPLFVLGFLSITSHFQSLRTQSLARHGLLSSFMGRQLEIDVTHALAQLRKTSDAEVLRSPNLFLTREAMAGWRHLSPALNRLVLLDKDRVVITTEPPNPEIEGKPYVDFPSLPALEGVSVSFVDEGENLAPRFSAARALGGSESNGYLVVEVSLLSWIMVSRTILKSEPDMIAGLLPTTARGVRVRITADATQTFWEKLAQIDATGTDSERAVDGESHHVTIRDIDGIPVKLVVAQPSAAIYAAPRRILAFYLTIFGVSFLVLVGLLFVLVRGVTVPIEQVADAASSFAAGNLEARAPVSSEDEVGMLAQTFNRMAESLNHQHLNMRVMYKSVMELFACKDVDSLMRKSTELTCTQCQGDAAWFLPESIDPEKRLPIDGLFADLRAWAWKNHRILATDAKQATGLWTKTASDRVFSFAIKSQGRTIGQLRVGYKKPPSEQLVSILHALVALIETAINKQEQVLQGAMLTTEVEMAEAVQRSIMSDRQGDERKGQIAYHYEPASRLGGDWFYLIDDAARDSLYVIIGDVTGHGLSQGLVTTAVKGALDVMEHLIHRVGNEMIRGPASIVSFLETVVTRVVASSKLTMTCLVAEIDFKSPKVTICNAGHTFPILARQENGEAVARHLYHAPQSMLGLKNPDHLPEFKEATFDLRAGDLLVIYTDGLTEARDLKSHVFGRFLMRKLKNKKSFSDAEQLKADILDMFLYYTQGRPVDDDVCFLVAQVPPSNIEGKRSA